MLFYVNYQTIGIFFKTILTFPLLTYIEKTQIAGHSLRMIVEIFVCLSKKFDNSSKDPRPAKAGLPPKGG